jgi:hypothetical protein
MTKQVEFVKNKLYYDIYYIFKAYCDYRKDWVEVPIDIQTDYEFSEINDTSFYSVYGKWGYETQINEPNNKSFVNGMPNYDFIKDLKFAFCFESYDDTIIFFKDKERFIQFKKDLFECFLNLLEEVPENKLKLFKQRIIHYLNYNKNDDEIKEEINQYYYNIVNFSK